MEGHTVKLRVDDEVKARRRAGGAWLRSLRERAGMSLRLAAERLDYPFHSMISQLEQGIGRIPPSRYRHWAEVYDIEPKEFVKGILRHYDRLTYDILFAPDEPVARPTSSNVVEIAARIDMPGAQKFLTDDEVIHIPHF